MLQIFVPGLLRVRNAPDFGSSEMKEKRSVPNKFKI